MPSRFHALTCAWFNAVQYSRQCDIHRCPLSLGLSSTDHHDLPRTHMQPDAAVCVCIFFSLLPTPCCANTFAFGVRCAYGFFMRLRSITVFHCSSIRSMLHSPLRSQSSLSLQHVQRPAPTSVCLLYFISAAVFTNTGGRASEFGRLSFRWRRSCGLVRVGLCNILSAMGVCSGAYESTVEDGHLYLCTWVGSATRLYYSVPCICSVPGTTSFRPTLLRCAC